MRLYTGGTGTESVCEGTGWRTFVGRLGGRSPKLDLGVEAVKEPFGPDSVAERTVYDLGD
jgi:hypothetical protein